MSRQQSQCKVEARLGKGQGKFKARSKQGHGNVKASSRQDQGKFMAWSRRGLGKVKARSRQGREARSTTEIASMSLTTTTTKQTQHNWVLTSS